jgi:hypothetical protein
MNPSMPTIPQAIGLAYRDLAFVARELSSLVMIAFAVVGGARFPVAWLAASLPPRSTASVLLGFVSGLVVTFLLTPYFIAIHRLIILGEGRPGYALNPWTARFQYYFTLWAAFSAATAAPLFVLQAWTVERVAAEVLFANVVLALTMAWVIAVMVAGLRLFALFPAIAVDAPGATIGNAFADSRGNAWRIFAIAFLAALPILLLGALVQGMTARGPDSGPVGLVVHAAVEGIVGTIELTVFVVIASRLFLWLGNRMNQSG